MLHYIEKKWIMQEPYQTKRRRDVVQWAESWVKQARKGEHKMKKLEEKS